MSDHPPAKSEQFGLLGTLIERIIQRVAELPDRTSPDDWPEAMMVTPAELRVIVAEEFEAATLPPAPPQSIEEQVERALSLARTPEIAEKLLAVMKDVTRGDKPDSLETRSHRTDARSIREDLSSEAGDQGMGDCAASVSARQGKDISTREEKVVAPAPPQEQERFSHREQQFLAQIERLQASIQELQQDRPEAASPPAQEQEPQALSELLELLWEMRERREGSTNAFYLMADRAFKLADKVAALVPTEPPT